MARQVQTERELRKQIRRAQANSVQFSRSWRSWWPVVIPIALAWWTYGGALRGEFVFDDVPAVRDNYALERIGGFWEAAFGAKHSPISNRPLVCLTFALNYAVGGLNPVGYHVVNLAIHCLNAAILFGVVRRTLVTPNLDGKYDESSATWTATALAAVWAAHPLGSEAVVYVTQRTTLLMSTFLLLTLYATLRSVSDILRRKFWKYAAVGFCALAMLCKEEAVAMPILVVLYDRAFHFASFSEAFAQRRRFYIGTAASVVLLIACVVISKAHNPTVGWNTIPEVNAWEWLLTESPVLVRYARLTLWPTPLVAAYDWPVVRSLGDTWFMVDISPVPIFLASVLVVTALGACTALWFWKPHWGWLGAWFFLLLAPTSSILPIVSEIAAERRMYLPMLAILAPVVIGLMQLGEWLVRGALGSSQRAAALAATPILIVAFAGSFEARAHARAFDTEATLWNDVFAKNTMTNGSFMSGQLMLGYSKILIDRKDYATAIPMLERALNSETPSIDVYFNLAAAYVDVGNFGRAEQLYADAFRLEPDHATGLSNLANLRLMQYQIDPPEKQLGSADPRLNEAYNAVRKSLTLNPRSVNAWNIYGSVCTLLDREQEAAGAWASALQLEPGNASVLANQAAAMARSGKTEDGIAKLEALSAQDPQNVELLIKAANAYILMGDVNTAVARLQRARELAPNNALVAALLQQFRPAPK